MLACKQIPTTCTRLGTNTVESPSHRKELLSIPSLVASLKECAKRRDLKQGKLLHTTAIRTGYHQNIYVSNTLIFMYGKCGQVQQARQVFDQMLKKDVVTWTSLTVGYVENGECVHALEMLSWMNCQPDAFALAAGAKACASAATGNKLQKEVFLETGVKIHLLAMELGFHEDVFLSTALVNMYCKLGDISKARSVFDGIFKPNIVSWTALICGYVENGQSEAALELYDNMNITPELVTCIAALKACRDIASGKHKSKTAGLLSKAKAIHKQALELGFHKNMVFASTLISVYSKFGEMVQSLEVFETMSKKDAVAWNVLILGYVENGDFVTALEMFNAMNVPPDTVIFVAGLKACSGLASHGNHVIYLEKGIKLHQRATELGIDRDVTVIGTLVDMYCRHKDMQRAQTIFDQVKNKTVVLWTCLIFGYVENGEIQTALNLFEKMDCTPNSHTFAAVLKACSSLGNLETGRNIHAQVCRLALEDEELVTTSLVDLYGKCGKTSVSECVFNGIHARETVTWTALIGGYSSLGCMDRVFRLVEEMQESGVEMNRVTMQHVLSACSRAGLVHEGQVYLESMFKHGVKPTVEHYGCMVDMLGRANKLREALCLIRRMPFPASGFIWRTFLAACAKWNNLEIGSIAFDAIAGVEEDKESVAASLLMLRSLHECHNSNKNKGKCIYV